MRVVDVMLSFPSQIMVFAVVALLGVSVQNVIIANVFIKWAWYARMIRTGVMQYRDRNFVQFSRCVGMPERFILFRHLLPSITSDLVVLASLDVGWAIINISTLSFSGTGRTGSYAGMGRNASMRQKCDDVEPGADDRSRYRHCVAAHNDWSKADIRQRSLEICWRKCGFVIRRRCWRVPASALGGMLPTEL